MAKKKTAIGDLIKSDMSRRSISEGTNGEAQGDEPPNSETVYTKPVHDAGPDNGPAQKKPEAPSAALPLFPDQDTLPEGSADLAAFLSREASSAGLTDEADLRKFYDFLQTQAMRYIRGFNAGRRFHG